MGRARSRARPGGAGVDGARLALRLAAGLAILLAPVAGLAQPISFAPPTHVTVAAQPQSVRAGDLNQDGALDLVVTHPSGAGVGSLSVLLGTGTGGFAAPTSIPFGVLPRMVAIGDLDRDGIPDLAVAEESVLSGGVPAQGVHILRGLGAGAFGPPTLVVAVSEPLTVAIADLDRDGDPDLITDALVSNSGLHVALNDGTGGFGPTTRFAIGTFHDIALGDFDRDGILDVAVARNGTNGISVLLGDGLGGLGAPTVYGAGTRIGSIVTGDLDADGRLDLVATRPNDDLVAVLRGNGDGTFAAPTTFAVGDAPRGLVIADLNGDGRPDVATANAGTSPAFVGTVSLLPGNGTGGFAPATTFPVGSQTDSLAVGDYDRDGRPDLAVVSQGAPGSATGTVSIFRNTTAFTPTAALGAGAALAVGAKPVAVALGDLDRDGPLDLAVANRFGDSVSVLLGNGDGTFGAPATLSVGTAPESLAIADLNRDGRPDLVTANFRFGVASDLSVLLAAAAGGFAPATSVPVGHGARSVAIGDLDRDGVPDLVVSNFNGDNLSILLGNGDGTFAAAPPVPVGSVPETVAIGDLNRDGIPDLAVANRGSHTVSVLLGSGVGTFAPAAPVAVGTGPTGLVLGDFNRDGRLDLAVTNVASGDVAVALGNGDGTFGGASFVPVGVHPTSLVVGDFDRDGRPDLAVVNVNGGGTSILEGNGSGGFALAESVAVGRRPIAAAVGDLDGDGIPDLTVANFDDDTVSILIEQPDQDGDGIANRVDRNRATGADESATPSSDFNDAPVGGGTTAGTIADRAGWVVRVVDTAPAGVQATLAGAGSGPARTESCEVGGPEEVRLDVAGESTAITCGAGGSSTVTAVLASPVIELRKPPGAPAAIASLTTGDTATVGSPIAASADNLQAILVTLVDAADVPFGSFQLDPGESVDVTFGTGTGTATVLTGTVAITAGGRTATLGPGESLAFLAGAPDAVLDLLAAAVDDFRAAGEIRTAGIARGLLASLDAARRAIARGDTATARGVLGALLGKLDAFTRARQITPAVRDALLPAVQLLSASLI